MTGKAFNLPSNLKDSLPLPFRLMHSAFKDMETNSTCSSRLHAAVDMHSNVFVADETLSVILCGQSSETSWSVNIKKVERAEGDEDCISIDWADNIVSNLQVADTARTPFQPSTQDLDTLQAELLDVNDGVFFAIYAA